MNSIFMTETGLEFDIREDEEQLNKLQAIIDLLVAAGYFRARIKSIPPFDKVIGGMVWCITLCSHSVDIDLFYSESATIGQKIALTEKVVEVLPQLKCPYSIEPHQIQGLDCIHIFPIVQWIVREAVNAKVKYGDSVRNFAVYQFNQRFRFSKGKEFVRERITVSNYPPNRRAKYSLLRIYKKKEGFKPSDLKTDVRCTMLEYGTEISDDVTSRMKRKHSGSKGVNENVTVDQFLEQSFKTETTEQRISMKVLAQIIDLSDINGDTFKKRVVSEQQDHKIISGSIVETERELVKLKEEEKCLDDSLQDFKRREEDQLQELNAINEKILKFEQLINSYDSKTIERLKHMLMEHDEIRKRESEFKDTCRKELQKLDDELEGLRAVSQSVKNVGDDLATKNVETKRHIAKIKLEIVDMSRQIAAQHRILDSVPTQTEISQYQRRIIELYNQMSSKHRETKQFYILHNTLVDMQKFMKREVDMLNSIDDVQDLTSRENYKESFVENLQRVLKAVDASLDMVLAKQKELQLRRDKLGEEYQCLLEKERLYHKAVDDLKNASFENEELKRHLEKR